MNQQLSLPERRAQYRIQMGDFAAEQDAQEAAFKQAVEHQLGVQAVAASVEWEPPHDDFDRQRGILFYLRMRSLDKHVYVGVRRWDMDHRRGVVAIVIKAMSLLEDAV
jgi:hypothetical protein